MGAGSLPFFKSGNHEPFPYTSTSSGILNADTAIKASTGILIDVLVYTDGTNNATVTIYDDPNSADGTVLAKVVVKGSDLMGGEVGILANAGAGIYMDISGTGATALIRYA